MMKKIVLLVVLFFVTSIIHANVSSIKDGSDDKSEIDLTITSPPIGNNKGNERSITVPYLNAYLYETSGIVEVELFDVGEASITILNSLGQVVVSDIVLTNIPTMSALEIPTGNGMYYIIIDSTEVYAQGWFVL